MRKHDAIEKFEEMDRFRRRVFTTQDLRKMFPEDGERAYREGISRLIACGRLDNPVRGVYVNARTQHPRTHLLYEVARAIRRDHHTYLSLESALSEYGIISQVPSGHTTFMTTGRKGLFETSYGTIEFTHTTQDAAEFVDDLVDNERPLPIATAERAFRDLRRVGRNLKMVQIDELEDEIARAKKTGASVSFEASAPVMPMEDLHAELC